MTKERFEEGTASLSNDVGERGVVYHHRGTKCIIRLCVSIHSLRHFYKGPITVLQEGAISPEFDEFLRLKDVSILRLGEPSEPVLIRKSQLWRLMPFKRAVYLDADTLVLGPIDELFELLNSNDVVVSWFSGWVTHGRIMSRRLREWARVDPLLVTPAIAYGKAVNGGVMGWTRQSSLLQEWEHLTRRGLAAGCFARTIDETASQMLLPHHPHALAHHSWNTSGAFGEVTGARILHFHGNKHLRKNLACGLWKEAYRQLHNSLPNNRFLCNPMGDRNLRNYLRESLAPPPRSFHAPGSNVSDNTPRQHDDMTIVTACDARYVAKLARNFPMWMQTPGLREQQFLVFLINLAFDNPAIGFLRQHANVRTVNWETQWNPRESALSAFVFGVAQNVSTTYWMKLDADTRPIAGMFSWPTYQKFTITAHRWGYTRVKRDPSATLHWLNTLDRWWGGTPMFPDGIVLRDKYWHKRICTFCAIEKTEFTRRLAERCGDRLPVPSQDTTIWYVATRWNEPICRMNMKTWLRP